MNNSTEKSGFVDTIRARADFAAGIDADAMVNANGGREWLRSYAEDVPELCDEIEGLREELKLADDEARKMREAYADAMREWAEGGRGFKLEGRAEMAAKICDLFYEFDGDPSCLWEHIDALDDALKETGHRA